MSQISFSIKFEEEEEKAAAQEFADDISDESILDEEIEEEEEFEELEVDISENMETRTEFANYEMSEYLETRTYHAPAMDRDLNIEKEQECGICLLEYKDEDTIGTLRCGHEFHTECINKWLQRKKTCPICRAPVLPTYDCLYHSQS
ncbi:E3 ubiquitin ligase BIG BROTHER-related-like [Lycium ferocissimum]|uniref:E3 ubiquitin ligase BIG BROTHER-related-like n=1 Tax=Lycium ferocissimum TaxID=112874 RepID=UPI002814ED17|nr:E3 ubiquitin ligase BIG BROTHER-related-like [Lycium ferocissimum]